MQYVVPTELHLLLHMVFQTNLVLDAVTKRLLELVETQYIALHIFKINICYMLMQS